MSGGMGKVAAVAAPIALGLAFPGIGTAIGGALLGEGAAGAGALGSALLGAGTGALGSAMTGQDPLTGAALGGIGGGISGGLGIGVGASSDPAVTALDSALGNTASTGSNAAVSALDTALGNTAANSTALASGVGSTAPNLLSSKYLLPALVGGATLLSGSGSSKGGLAPTNRYDDTAHNVKPMQREMIASDPSAYYGTGGNRSSFVNDNPATQFYADGGSVAPMSVRDIMNSARAKVAAPPLSGGNTAGGLVNPNSFYSANGNRNFFPDRQITTPQAVQTPVSNPLSIVGTNGYLGAPKYNNQYLVLSDGRTIASNSPEAHGLQRPRQFAKGGLAMGAGDGTSDSVPAMLSTGEYVIPAAVVAALGNGDNKAGAKHLDMMKNNVLAKHYKNGKAPKALGIGAYMQKRTA